jgi:hypothetical protein
VDDDGGVDGGVDVAEDEGEAETGGVEVAAGAELEVAAPRESVR